MKVFSMQAVKLHPDLRCREAVEREAERDRGLEEAESFPSRRFGVLAPLYTELYTDTPNCSGFSLAC